MTTACGICGKLNRKNARFCVGCAARLGIEPVGHSIPGAAFADSRRDAGLDSTRNAGHFRPTAVRTEAQSSREPAMFWLRAGIAGLVLLIGFVGWCMYVLTSHKVVAPLQANTNTSIPAEEPQARSQPAPAPMAAAPATTAPAAPAVATASKRIATVAPPVPTAKPYAATGTEADASIASTASSVAGPAPNRLNGSPATTPRNSYARERNRRQEPPDAETSTLPPGYSWAEPSRQPANTLNPGYADPGPPVVQGPGPRYASSVPSPVEVSPSYESVAPMRGPDAGPPIAPGPGPRYDFSTPGAIPR